jgi:hypothetical protein
MNEKEIFLVKFSSLVSVDTINWKVALKSMEFNCKQTVYLLRTRSVTQHRSDHLTGPQHLSMMFVQQILLEKHTTASISRKSS